MFSGGARADSSYFSRMSFLTDLTPPTPRVTSIALLTSACELTKPLSRRWTADLRRLRLRTGTNCHQRKRRSDHGGPSTHPGSPVAGSLHT